MAIATAQATIAAPSIYELARRVYAIHGTLTSDAIQEYLGHIDQCGQTEALLAWAAERMLDSERLRANKPAYSTAHAIQSRLAVEPPPPGYQSPTGVQVRRDNSVLIRPGLV